MSTLKNLLANKSRMALTSLAIVLGVGFVVASLITSDGLRDAFGGLSQDIASESDLTVRYSDEFGSTAVVDQALVDQINAIDGVDVAEGRVGGFAQPIAPDGTPLPAGDGPPLIGLSWPTDEAVHSMTIVDGAAPGDGQFVIDVDTAEQYGYTIGDTYTVASGTGSHEFQLSGVHRFGDDNALLGAVMTAYTLDDARTVLGVDDEAFGEISIAVGSTTPVAEVETAVGALLPDGIEVVNQQTVEQETAAEFNNAITVAQNIFLGFAGVSLFVSIFIIYNTFGVVLAQRVRHNGLMRAIGATPGQIRRGVLTEAAIVGSIASVIGIAAGVGIHLGLLAAFDLIGAGLPASDLIIAPRTIIVGLVVGLGTTMVSALVPALRAGAVSPMVALSGTSTETRRNPRRVTLSGVTMVALGIGLGAIGFQGVGGTVAVVASLAAGAALVFVGIALLSPLLVGPVIGSITRPLALVTGPAGELAGKNAVRHAGRTATTASSLMIGLALITTALVVGQSFKAQVGESLTSATTADYLIDGDFNPFPVDVVDALNDRPELASTVGVGYESVQAESATETIQTEYAVAELTELTALIDFGIDDGVIDASTPANAIMLPATDADELGLSVGDELSITFVDGAALDVVLAATFTDQSLSEAGLLNQSGVAGVYPIKEYVWAVTEIAGSAGDADALAAADAALSAELAAYPQLGSTTVDEYGKEIEAQIDGLLNAISLLLALAIIIALIGIGLTLALAVVERTREIGLLRSVGMTSGQTRRMIRWEAAVIATYGALLGVIIGLGFGWAVVTAIPDSFIGAVSIPVGRLGVMVGAAAVAGLVAALLPARRAGRLNVLDAIAAG